MEKPKTNVRDLIPDWDHDDFLTNAPLEWLYGFHGDPVKQRQMLVLVAEKAAAEGIRSFRAMWTDYLKMLRATRDDPQDNVTQFSDQPIELTCGVYNCSDLGIFGINNFGSFEVCAHPIMPVRRLINIDTGEVKQEIAFQRGKRWRKVVFDKQVLSSSQKIVGLASYGIGVDSENAKGMVAYLSAMENMNYDQLPEASSVGRLGWVDGYGFSPYVDNLVFDGNDSYRHMFECVRTHGDESEWMALAKEVRAGNSIAARVMLAASFASVLVKPMDALPFMVHVWGGAGAGKTVGLMLAASVWAAPSVGDYCKSFNGTDVAGELQAAFCGNLPLCLDELQVIKERKDFDRLIYMLCEGVGRNRGAKAGGLQRTPSWRNCTISTGEQPITNGNSGAGAVNRVLEIDCKEEQLFADPRAAVSTLTRNFGHAGKRFVSALSDAECMDTAIAIQQAFLAQLTGKATDKQTLAASLILTADTLAEMLLFKDGKVLTVDEILPNLTTASMADANRRAYNWLMDTIASNPARFQVNQYNEYSGECWGAASEGEGRVYIIKSVFDRLMCDAGYSAESFLSWAKRQNLLKLSGGHNTVLKRLKGLPSAARCVAIESNRDENGDTIVDTNV